MENQLAKVSQGIAKSSSVPLLPIKAYDDLLSAKPICNQIKAHGIESVKVTIAKSLVKCASILEVEMPPVKLDVITEDLMELYPVESLEDIVLALKMGRRGEFGKVYGRLSMEVINNWVAQVLDAKYQLKEAKLKTRSEQGPEPFESQEQVDEWYRKGQEYQENLAIKRRKLKDQLINEKKAIAENERKYQEFKNTHFGQKPDRSAQPSQAGQAAGEGKPVSSEYHEPDTDLRGNYSGENRGPAEAVDHGKETVQE